MSQILNGAINIKDGMTSVLEKISKRLKTMSQQMPTMINNIDRVVGSMSSKLKKHEADIAAHQNRMLNNMRRNQEKFIQYIHKTPREIERANAKMSAKARSLAMHQQNISMGLATAGLPGAYVGFKATKSFAQFDQVMADLRAKTLDNFANQYKKQAISLGMSSRYSPTEVGKAQIILAKAGYQGQKLLNVAPSVINMASANDMTMEDAAAAMIAAKNTFRVGDSIEALNKVVDTLSFTANKTNSDVKDLIVSMNYAGSTAKDYGMTLEEQTFFTGKMRDFGMSASTSGTSMNQFLERILSNTDAQDVMKKRLGTDLYVRDEKGNPLYRKNIFEVISSLRKGFDKLNIEQREMVIKDVAETRGRRFLSRILSIDPEELEKSRQEFMEFEKIKGYAAQMERERLKSYTGQVEKLKSGFESISVSVGQLITDMGLFNWLTKVAEKFEDFVGLFLDYNTALNVANGNVEVAKILMGDKVWSDSLQFIIGFRQGIEDVVQVAKQMYEETMKFFGVFGEGKSIQGLGQTVAQVAGVSMLLTPLGIGMLFVKNITMGLYSSFAFLGTAMMHASEGVSKIRKLFNKPEEIIDAITGNTSSTDIPSSKTSKKNFMKEILAEYAGEKTLGDSANRGRINYADNIDFYNTKGESIGDLSDVIKENTNSNKAVQAIATSTGLGTSSIGSGRMSRKSKGHVSITDIVNDALGVSDGNSNAFGGSTTKLGKFGSNSVAKAADKIADATDTINDMSSISDNLSQKKTKNAIQNIVDSGANIANPSDYYSFKDPTAFDSLTERRSLFLQNTGLGVSTLNDEPGRKSFKEKLKGGAKGFGGFLGALGDNYMTAGLFGSERAKNTLKGGLKGADNTLSNAKKSIMPNLKLAAMVAAESLLPDLDFGGGEYEKDNKGKSKFKKGKDIRKGLLNSKIKGLKSLPSAAVDKAGSLLKNGFASFMASIPAAMSMLGTFITTVLSPFALILGSIAVIGAALFLTMKKDGESWGEMFGRILKNITDTAMFLWTEVFVPFGKGLAEAFGPTITMIQEAFVAMGERLTPMFKRIAAMFSGTEEGGLGKNMKYVGEMAGWALNKVLLPAINLIITALEIVVGFLGDIIELFTSLATGNFSNFGRTIFRMFARLITGIFQLLATSIGNIIQLLPESLGGGMGGDLIEWSRENLDADKWTNSVFGENRVDEEVMLREEAKKQKEYLDSTFDFASSNNEVYGDEYAGSSSPLEEIVSSFDTGDAETNAEIEKQAREKDAKEQKELLKKIAKNTGDPCDTNLDGKKISKNQERHQAINRQQGAGRVALRTSKQQGRVN